MFIVNFSTVCEISERGAGARSLPDKAESCAVFTLGHSPGKATSANTTLSDSLHP